MKTDYTILIPVYNELHTLPRLLKWVMENCKDANKVLICSDGSTDGTNDMLKKWELVFPTNYEVHYNKVRTGKVGALNFLMPRSRTDIVITLDADIVPTENAIKNTLKHFDDKMVGCVCGYHIVMNEKRGIINYVGHIIFRAKREQDKYCTQTKQFFHVNGMFCGYRLSILPRIDFSGASEDAFTGWMIWKKGFKNVYADDVGIKFYAPMTFRDYFKSRKRTILGRIRLKKEYALQMRLFNEIPFGHHTTTIFEATPIGVRWYLALWFAVSVEIVLRTRYYLCYNIFSKEVKGAWTQLKSTKK